jgi:hypothetical protein
MSLVTPDDFPGVRQEEGTIYTDEATAATAEGEVRYNAGKFSLFDNNGSTPEFDPNPAGATHSGLDTFLHGLSENHFTEVIRTAGQVTSVIVWTDSGKTVKVRETTITRTGGLVDGFVQKQYDAAGTTVVETLTSTVARTGNQVESIDTVKS